MLWKQLKKEKALRNQFKQKLITWQKKQALYGVDTDAYKAYTARIWKLQNKKGWCYQWRIKKELQIAEEARKRWNSLWWESKAILQLEQDAQKNDAEINKKHLLKDTMRLIKIGH